jgi:hypothetical protein
LSLIGEALKRARLESARREGEERGTAHSSMPAYLPARRRSGAGWVIATALSAAAGAGVVYLLLTRAPPSTPENSARPPLLGKEETATVSDSAATAAAPAPSSPAEAAVPPSPASQAASPSDSALSPQSPPPPAPAADPLPPRVPAAPPVADPVSPGARVYVSVAELGATKLELDGIVASPTDPVVMINRKLLGIGEGIEGWVVEKIETKQVTLRGGGETIVLRLR